MIPVMGSRVCCVCAGFVLWCFHLRRSLRGAGDKYLHPSKGSVVSE